MKSVNKVILLGNATRDAESKTSEGKRTMCKFGLATNRVWKDKAGTTQEQAEFHNLVCWGKLAEIAAKFVAKGKPLYIEGHLHTSAWEGEDKTKKKSTEIIVDNMVFVGNKKAPTMASAEAEVVAA